MLDVKKAMAEVLTKSDALIEAETAWNWASRSVACYLLYRQSGDLKWLLRAEDFRHEAIEHGALASDATLRAIRVEINRVRSGK